MVRQTSRGKRYAAAILIAFTAYAQAPQAPIGVSTHLVEVSVVVRDKNGPVTKLSANDFTLSDQGKPQKIASFSMVSVRPQTGVGSAADSAKPASPLPPNIYSNRPETKSTLPASTTVVLLDGLNTVIRDQSYAKRQFLEFLKQVKPTDRIAVYALSTQLRVLHEFTTDSRRLVAAVARFTGANLSKVDASDAGSSDSGDFVIDSWLNDSNGMIADRAIIDRAETTAAALEAIANHIGRLPGRKSLVWISGSFPLSIGHLGADGVTNWEDAAFDQEITMVGHGSSKTSGGQGAGMSQDTSMYGVNLRDGNPARDQVNFQKILLRATKALSDANISVYPVDARGLIGLPKSMTAEGSTSVSRLSVMQPTVVKTDIPTGHAAMMVVAENTGGRVFDNTNDIHAAIRTAIDDAEVTYLLGFYPGSAALDGKFHQLKLQVNRPGVEVRFRKGYLASPDIASTGQTASLKEAIAAPIEATGISLTAGIEKDQPKPGSLRLTVAVEPKDIDFQSIDGKWSATLDLGFSFRAGDGRDLNFSTQAMNLHLTKAQYDAVMQDGMTVTKIAEWKPEMAQIRVGVFGRATGKVGSMIIPLGR